MTRRRTPNRRTETPPPPRSRPSPLLLLVIAFALVLPIFYLQAMDMFREPKELLLRLEAIAVAAALVTAAILGRPQTSWRETIREPWMIIAVAAVTWSAVSTITALNRYVSTGSLAYIAAMAAVFVGSVLALRQGGVALAAVPFLPAAVNVTVLVLQEMRVWTPYPALGQWIPTGLVGNSSDVGCYLMVVSLAAAALAAASRRWRPVAIAAAVIFALGTVATATLTAVGALAAGLVVLGAMRSFRAVAVALAVVVFTATVGLMAFRPAQQRLQRLSEAVTTGSLDQFFSFRFVAYVTAWMMVVDHPVTGVGPGGYGPQFFEYRDRAEARYEFLRNSAARAFNFGEAHNDHLQVMAQTGVPGYAIFLAALVFLARISLRRTPESDEGRLAHYLALPLVAGFGILALAQFPMELASALHTALYYAAAAVAWSGRP